MRRVIYALLAFAFAPSAFADDLSWLTGPQATNVPVVNGWAGIYIGGQVSYSGRRQFRQHDTRSGRLLATRDDVGG